MTPAGGLGGPRVRLLPADRQVATAVIGYDSEAVSRALLRWRLTAGPGWPHADSADALRALADGAADACWLVAVGGEVVGDCGWRPGLPGELELGFGLAVPARGRGLATEAVGVLAGWADRQPGVTLLTADVLVGNEPSRRLLARLGFSPTGQRADYLRLERPVVG